jgi:integrase
MSRASVASIQRRTALAEKLLRLGYPFSLEPLNRCAHRLKNDFRNVPRSYSEEKIIIPCSQGEESGASPRNPQSGRAGGHRGDAGRAATYVFTHLGRPLSRMNNRSWRKARWNAGLPHVRVHDRKHAFGRRLRAAGISFKDRQDLLGHKSGRITTHYSMAEIENLINSANAACGEKSRTLYPEKQILPCAFEANGRNFK